MSLRPKGGFWLVTLMLAGWPWTAAHAHQSSNSFLQLHSQENHIDGRWDIALRDLDQVLALDTDDDGQLRWGEVRTGRTAIVAYAAQALQLSTGTPCAIDWQPDLQLESHADGRYAVLRFRADCTPPMQDLRLHYTLFAEADAGHRGLLSFTADGVAHSAVAGPDAPTLRFDVGRPSTGAALLQYLRMGVTHIFGGYDHLLFLLSLLLPAVLVRTAGQWLGQRSLRTALLEVGSVVTAFTLAHSLTLGLAVFGVLRVSARWSESAIALSVLLAALNNLAPQVLRRRWLVAFAFGLIHGLGFANVLRDLALPAGQRALALLGFNLGVEAGQLCIVLAFVPLAYGLRETRFYRRAVLPGGSALVAVLSALWLVERLLDQKWHWLP